MFFLLYKSTDDGVFDDFRRLPTTFRRFPKIFQNCSEGQTNVPEHFPRISENFRRLPKTFEEDPKMFRWYTNEFKYNLRDKLDVSEIVDIFTCEDIISSHVRISYRFYQFLTTRYTTDFYIIKWNSCLYLCFVDFDKAFDSVHRETLWHLLKSYGIPTKLVNMVKAMYKNCRCAVMDETDHLEWFEVLSGVRQGCVMSGFLFLIVIDWVMRRNCGEQQKWNQMETDNNPRWPWFCWWLSTLV